MVMTKGLVLNSYSRVQLFCRNVFKPVDDKDILSPTTSKFKLAQKFICIIVWVGLMKIAMQTY